VYELKDNVSQPKAGFIAYGSGSVVTDEGMDTVRVVDQDVQDFPISQIVKDSLDVLHTEEAIYGVLGLMHKKNATGSETLFSRLRNTGRMTSMGYCRDAMNDNGTFIWGDSETSGNRIEVVGQKHWAVELTNVVTVPHVVEVTTTSAPSADSTSTVYDDPDFTVLKKKLKQADYNPYDGTDQTTFGAPPDDFGTDVSPDGANTHGEFNACPGKKDCVVIVDTGSNILACPTRTYDQLLSSLSIARDCSNFHKLPDISLTMGDFNVTVPPTSYVMKMSLPAWAKESGDTGLPEASPGAGEQGAGGESFPNGGYAQQDQPWSPSDGEPSPQGGGMLGQIKREEVLTPWERTFKHLNRKHGFDLRVALRGVSVRSMNASDYICMPAIFPLDSVTTQGALWVVGTPIFDSYYARWSWPLKSGHPEVYLQNIHEATACAETLAATEATPKTPPPTGAAGLPDNGEPPQAESLAAARKVLRSRGPHVRDPEQIRFPYWARNLAEV